MARKQIEIVKFTKRDIDDESKAKLVRNLMCASLIEAVKDYIKPTFTTGIPDYFLNRDIILNDLKSPRMIALTDGLSLSVANALENNEEEIRKNLDILDDCDLIKVIQYGPSQYR